MLNIYKYLIIFLVMVTGCSSSVSRTEDTTCGEAVYDHKKQILMCSTSERLMKELYDCACINNNDCTEFCISKTIPSKSCLDNVLHTKCSEIFDQCMFDNCSPNF